MPNAGLVSRNRLAVSSRGLGNDLGVATSLARQKESVRRDCLGWYGGGFWFVDRPIHRKGKKASRSIQPPHGFVIAKNIIPNAAKPRAGK
jgi:hypothetical protein